MFKLYIILQNVEKFFPFGEEFQTRSKRDKVLADWHSKHLVLSEMIRSQLELETMYSNLLDKHDGFISKTHKSLRQGIADKAKEWSKKMDLRIPFRNNVLGPNNIFDRILLAKCVPGEVMPDLIEYQGFMPGITAEDNCPPTLRSFENIPFIGISE
jgi:hypothetical protein